MARFLKFLWLWRHDYCGTNRERWHVAWLMADTAAWFRWQNSGCNPKTKREWWP